MEQFKHVQVVRKLYTELSSAAGPVSTGSPELKQLWDLCTGSDAGDGAVVAASCCDALLTMVRDQRLQLAYVLHGFINQAPNAKHVSTLVRGVSELLLYQLYSHPEGKAYICPYNIRQPPHPFVSVLINRADSWPCLLQQCQRMLSLTNERISGYVLPMLLPFLRYVLLEPQPSASLATLRASLVPALLRGGSAGNQQDTIGKIMEMLPAMQISSIQHISEHCLLLESLSHAVSTTTSRHDATEEQRNTMSSYSDKLALYAGEMCEVVMDQQLDPRGCMDLMKTCMDNKSDAVSTRLYIVLVFMMEKLPYANRLQLLSIAEKLLSSNGLPPLAAGMLCLPLLNMVAMANPVVTETEKLSQQKAASELMKKIEEKLISIDDIKEYTGNSGKTMHNFTPNGYTVEMLANLTTALSANHNVAYNWLCELSSDWLKTDQSQQQQTTFLCACVVSSLLIGCEEEKVIAKSLEVLGQISKKDPNKCPSLLSVLLYKMSRDKRACVKHCILTALPNIATHKSCLAPILHTLQHVGGTVHMKAVSLRLVTSLWQQQDRCFPQLQHMILEREHRSVGREDGKELTLAKAASIRDICMHRPARGEDMLGALSAILNECVSDDQAAAAALALDGLYHLCEAEVVDIRTAWSVLAAKLSTDTRSLVLCHICRLFSLVPVLSVNTPEYEGFSAEVIERLWQYVCHDDQKVAAAAYKALAHFSPELFNLHHLPKQVTAELFAAAQEEADAAAAKAPQGFEVELVLPPIAGHCYTRLLDGMHEDVMPAYKEFLSALLADEVSSLPRGIYHASSRKYGVTGSTNQERGLGAIPQCLQREYDHNRQPGLRPALAGSLLFGYDPVLPLNKEGKAKKTEQIKYGRTYHQMMSTLLQEVPLYTSVHPERGLSLPAAWTLFMDRCFHAYTQCHRAELQVQLEKGRADDPEENSFQQNTAWLWARDKLTDVIKSVSRGSPSVQGSCLLALSGLAVASTKYAAGLDGESLEKAAEATEHLSQSHWLSLVVHTTLAIMDYTYQPPGRTFNICMQRGEKERSPAPVLARSGACLCLAQLVPLLITSHADLVTVLLSLLTPGLTQQEPTLAFHYGLATGLVLAALFEERFSDTAGEQGHAAVWEAVGCLEFRALQRGAEGGSDGSEEGGVGALLGLGACVAAMCQDGGAESRDRVLNLQHTLMETLARQTEDNLPFIEGLCVCLAAVGSGAYATNIVDQDGVNAIVAALYQQHSTNMQSSLLCLSLGMLCHGLATAGHPTIADLAPQLWTTWYSKIQQEEEPVTVPISGAHAMAGGQQLWLKIESSGEMSNTGASINDFVTACSDLLKAGDMSVHGNIAWVMGQLYQASTAAQHSRSTVPSNYGYLPDTSVLKASVQVLIDAAKTGIVPPCTVQTVVSAFVHGPSQALPPLNWPAVLSPVMRRGYGFAVEWSCLKLAVNQSPSSPTAALLVSSWLLSPLHNTLSRESRLGLYQSLPTLIKTVSPVKLQEYLERGYMLPWIMHPQPQRGQEAAEDDRVAAVSGLAAALKVPDPPQSITKLLYTALETLYTRLQKSEQQPLALVDAVCKCLEQVPPHIHEQVLDAGVKGAIDLYVRVQLVTYGSQPLASINKALEEAAVQQDRHVECLSVLLHGFASCGDGTGKDAQKRQQWLLEIMGFIRNLVTKQTTLSQEPNDVYKTVHFLLCVFAAALVTWSRCPASIALSLTVKEHCKQSSIQANQDESLNAKTNDDQESEQQAEKADLQSVLFRLLPSAMEQLLMQDTMQLIASRMLEWLLTICTTESVTCFPHVRDSLKGCLYLLRHRKEFSPGNVWTRACSL